MDIGDLDLQIIRLLQEDGRLPSATIARQLHLPEATVRRHIGRLIREQTLKIVAVVDDKKLGLALHVVVGLQVDIQETERLANVLCQLEEVRWVGMTTGSYDLMFEAFFRSTRHFHDFLMGKIAKFPGVKRTETVTVLKLLKDTYRWDELVKAGKDHDGRDGSGEEGEYRFEPNGGEVHQREDEAFTRKHTGAQQQSDA